LSPGSKGIMKTSALTFCSSRASTWDALHNPSRFVPARPRAVCGVAFIANSTRYWPQNAPCIPSRSALHSLAWSYAEHPLRREYRREHALVGLCGDRGQQRPGQKRMGIATV
jgi:hypothetical protein